MASSNIYARLRDGGLLLEVPMDTAKILQWGGRLTAIGTENLNACSGIVVLGERAILLAHIAPLPPHPLGADPRRSIAPNEGEVHFQSILDEVRRLHNLHQSLFSANTMSWAIFARFEGKVAMPEKLEIAKQYFASRGLSTQVALYDIGRASQRTNPAAGTVVALWQGGKVYLYVEDQLKDTIDCNQQAHAVPWTSSARGQPARPIASSSTQPARTIASSSAGQTSTRPVVQAQGFWMYSTGMKIFGYRALNNTPVPQSQWPRQTGRHPVMIAETRQLWSYDFDSKQWFEGAQ